MADEQKTEKPKPMTLAELMEGFRDGAFGSEHPAMKTLCARLVVLTGYVRRLEAQLRAMAKIGESLEKKVNGEKPAAPAAQAEAPTESTEEELEASLGAQMEAETAAEIAAVKTNGQAASS